jgi:hypothetical protein
VSSGDRAPDHLTKRDIPDDSTSDSHHLAQHNYMDNGLVAVNPNGRHPIYDLLSRSQAAWKEKKARQSRTLRQATKEYRRRYQRPPPKGFDKWYVRRESSIASSSRPPSRWQYMMDNNVQLPDEYDQIVGTPL